MKSSPSLTEISQSGDDVGPFVQTFVYPSGNLSQTLIRQEQKRHYRHTTLKVGYFVQKFLSPSGDDICRCISVLGV